MSTLVSVLLVLASSTTGASAVRGGRGRGACSDIGGCPCSLCLLLEGAVSILLAWVAVTTTGGGGGCRP